MAQTESIQIKEGRFSRLEAIEWWDQALLGRSRVLVVGAGALGNEVLKNLAMLGVGHVVVVDMDSVELSNLSRSILFREGDEGRAKAECAAEAARDIYAGVEIRALVGNVLADVGLGYFRWADVVVGALDNREARVFVNSACARLGKPWFDGGIEVLQGIVRGFAPPRTACYECTMSQVDWDLVNKRRSCSLLARRALAQRGTPTTPTTASIIGAMQVAEVVKHLHGLPAMLGSGLVFDGAGHSSYSVSYPINPECGWHDEPSAVEPLEDMNSDKPLAIVWQAGVERLGSVDALDLARELVERVECPSCRHVASVLRPAEKVGEAELWCPVCRQECAPVFVHSIAEGSPLLRKTPRELGLPSWEIVWCRAGDKCLGCEVAGDNPWAASHERSEQ
jgi:molybdopterin/thiamine biosynthesis adenylyltransferase